MGFMAMALRLAGRSGRTKNSGAIYIIRAGGVEFGQKWTRGTLLWTPARMFNFVLERLEW
jgi:hypothetical protein